VVPLLESDAPFVCYAAPVTSQFWLQTFPINNRAKPSRFGTIKRRTKMATRCLYCGGSSWRAFRWLRDQEFCSGKHRQLYRARLQRVLGELARNQSNRADPVPRFSDPASHTQATQLGGPAAVDLFPMRGPAPAHSRMAPTIVLRDRTLVHDLTEVLGLASEAPTTVWLPPDIFPSGLQASEGQSGAGISPCAPPVAASGERQPIQCQSDALPVPFENYVQIRRWGLKIRFHRF